MAKFKMKKFEDKTFSGPLAEFLEGCQPHRIEAIYNREYKYIKQIIWDDELNEKYGSTREGYERYKNEVSGYSSYSGEIDLRVNTDRDGVITGYFIETKRLVNTSFDLMKKQYELAREKFFEILKVNDRETVSYWLDENARKPFGNSFRTDANSTIGAIEDLEEIINNYNEDEDFKRFFDKLKQ